MTDFERSLVKSFNRYFDEQDIPGIAYRRKQHRFSSQFVDVLVDSFNPDFYLAIENKSLKLSSSNKLYFSQHFSEANDKHQVERITDFVERSGRTGFLAVELRRGRGRPRKAFLVPWEEVKNRYHNEQPGLAVDEIQEFPQIKRDGEQYRVDEALDNA